MDNALSIHPKVAASVIAGALTTIVVYSLRQWAHVELPIEVGAALTVVFGFAAGWLAPSTAASAPTPSEPPAA